MQNWTWMFSLLSCKAKPSKRKVPCHPSDHTSSLMPVDLRSAHQQLQTQSCSSSARRRSAGLRNQLQHLRQWEQTNPSLHRPLHARSDLPSAEPARRSNAQYNLQHSAGAHSDLSTESSSEPYKTFLVTAKASRYHFRLN